MSASTSYMLTLPSRANQPRAAYNSFSFSFVADDTLYRSLNKNLSKIFTIEE